MSVFEFGKFHQSVSQVDVLLLIVFIMHFVAQREYIYVHDRQITDQFKLLKVASAEHFPKSEQARRLTWISNLTELLHHRNTPGAAVRCGQKR